MVGMVQLQFLVNLVFETMGGGGLTHLLEFFQTLVSFDLLGLEIAYFLKSVVG